MGNIPPKKYENIKVPKELKIRIKTLASKKNLTIIKLLQNDYGK